MHHLTAQWIPPNERSKFLTSYLGSSVGIAVFYPLFGYIISSFAWETVFYVSGIFGTLWYVAWLYFVYDSPAKHPRIDIEERLYIEKSLCKTVHTGKVESSFSFQKLSSILLSAKKKTNFQFVSERKKNVEKNTVDFDSNFDARLGEYNWTIWWYLGFIHANDTSTDLFSCRARMECPKDRPFEWHTAYGSDGVCVCVLFVCGFIAKKENI